jgi:hypothetical protein
MDPVTRDGQIASNGDGRGVPPEALPYDGPASPYEEEAWDESSELDALILADLLRLAP